MIEHSSTFGQYLQQAREGRNLTPRNLARGAGVSEGVYLSWEADEERPNRLQLTKMFGSNHWIQRHLPRKEEIQAPPSTSEVSSSERPTVIVQTFGAALGAERENAALAQDELGAMLTPPVTDQAVSSWEANVTVPVRTNLEQLYELFPALVWAPKPPSQDIPVPDGGKNTQRAPRPTAPIEAEAALSDSSPLSITQNSSIEPGLSMPLPASTSTSQPKDVSFSSLLEHIHTTCTKLHGGEWRIQFFVEDGTWHAVANKQRTAFKYRGSAKSLPAPGSAHDALIDLLREAHKEVDRRRKLLDELERDLPKDVF